MAKYVIEFPNGEMFEFNSKVQYRYAVVEFDGEEWQVFRKSKSFKNAKDAMYYASMNYNCRDWEKYEVVSIKQQAVEQVC
jgi:hypothetical protein